MVKISGMPILPRIASGEAPKPRSATAGSFATALPLAQPPVEALKLSPLGRWLGLKSGSESTSPLKGGEPTDAAALRKQEVIEVGKQFEAVFLRYLISGMRGSGKGEMSGSEYYEGLIDENLSRILAESGSGIQLGEMLAHGMDATAMEDDS